jgi:PEP-CTERM motif
MVRHTAAPALRNKYIVQSVHVSNREIVMKFKHISIAVAALVASTAPAHAALTIYTSLAAFNAATTAQGTDTFTGLSIVAATPSPINRLAGAYGYQGTVSTTSFFGAGTVANPWLSTNTATDTMTFSLFTGGVQAGGGNFFGSDITGAFAAGNITIVATDSLGATSTQTITGATTSSFLGFVSNANLVSLTVTSVQPQTGFLWPTMDNFVLAKRAGGVVPIVPEPGTWLMMVAGFGLVGGAMRRRSTMRIAQAV